MAPQMRIYLAGMPLYDANGKLNWALYNGANTWFNPLSFTLRTFNVVTEY